MWLRPRVVEYVKASSSRYSVELSPFKTQFPNATVIRMRAAFAGLKALLLDTASVIEIRPASTANVPISALTPVERAGLVRKIASRIAPPPEGSPRVAILDTGVQFQHGLLRQSLPEARTHTVLPAWQKDDVDGHGTRMAGVALFGDLNRFVSGSSAIPLTHALKSVTLIGKGGATMGPAQRLSAALAKIERDDARRVYSLSWSVPMERDDGAPTELSSHLDQLAFGRDQSKRLFCVAAGNLDSHPPLLVADYIGTNDRSGILTPGQAANALTVGAYTDMVGPASKQSHAGRGDLCPSSRTAMSWKTHLAFKPDIVMEGGNRLVDSDGMSLSFSPDLSVLTTSNQFPRLPFEPGCETSIATAAAAGMAARLMSEYPSFWPETIRGLMVHSARWTPAMLNRLPGGRKKDVVSLLRKFGWGVPDETRARQSASNALTIIMQDDLDAFELKRDGAKFRHMRFCRLPWPKVALESIAAADVEMRVTLSYFAEPHPLAASHAELRNYFSHALAFRLCGPDDTDDEAIALINKCHREKGHKKSSARRKDHWMLGPRQPRMERSSRTSGAARPANWPQRTGFRSFRAMAGGRNLRTTVVPQTRVRFLDCVD